MARKTKKKILEYGTDVPASADGVSMPETLRVPIDTLVPRYATRAENPNRMDEDRFVLLKQAIAEEGFLQPILVTDLPDVPAATRERLDGPCFRIEDGHHRWWAAKEAGAREVLIVIRSNIVEARARLLGIGMNRLRGEVDLTAAAQVIGEAQALLDLQPMELSMLTGFSTVELDTLLGTSEDVSDILDEGAQDVSDEDKHAANVTFVLEISFVDREKFKLAKRALRKAGKGDMMRGLLALLGEEGAA